MHLATPAQAVGSLRVFAERADFIGANQPMVGLLRQNLGQATKADWKASFSGDHFKTCNSSPILATGFLRHFVRSSHSSAW
jgi:hypothetical protein